MNSDSDFLIKLPRQNSTLGSEDFLLRHSLVIIGANGAGKTRLGAWIEKENETETSPSYHRISAQKALNIPETVVPKTMELARKDLNLGRSDKHADLNRKSLDRWGGNPATHLLDDFERLLSVLFARDIKRNADYITASRGTALKPEVPDSPIDEIVRLWGAVMPHRTLSFDDGMVLVKGPGANNYHGKEMSDGERVVLYLIGQCLCAPEGSVIIIDEPEIHLHKALMDSLWNNVEAAIPDKKIIYITHDLDFAASRSDAAKIWVKSFNDDLWEWEEVSEDEYLPASLVMEILGNRKKTMFCEGDSASYDKSIYQDVYPHYYIIPLGSCTKVIESTKALRGNSALHNLDAVGLVDLDYMEAAELEALEDHGIRAPTVVEVESLFCVKSVLAIVATHLGLDSDTVIEDTQRRIYQAFEAERDLQISAMADRKISHLLSLFSNSPKTEQDLHNQLSRTIDSVDISKIYGQCKDAFDAAILTEDLDALLRLYNRKKLFIHAAAVMEQSNQGYPKLILRLLDSSLKLSLISAFKEHLPDF